MILVLDYNGNYVHFLSQKLLFVITLFLLPINEFLDIHPNDIMIRYTEF